MDEKILAIQLEMERTKSRIDYVKHLTTLSTGALILVSAFSDKLFPHPLYGFLINLAIISFLVSILGSVALHTIYVAKFPPIKGGSHFDNKVITVGLVIAWLGFIGGIISLGVFVLANLSN